MEKQTFSSVKSIHIQKVAGNLYVRPWDNADVEIRYNSSKKFDAKNISGTLTVDADDSILISTPSAVNIVGEDIRGNCSTYGKINNLQIEKISGNFEVAEGTDVQVRLIAGNCVVGAIDGTLTIKKVGGNMHSEYTQGNFSIENIGGNLYAHGELCDFSCDVGGNVKLVCTALSGNENRIRAGGNIKMNIEPNMNFSLSARTGAQANIKIGEEEYKGGLRLINKSFGTGGTKLTLKAGGNIKLSDTEPIEKKSYQQKPYDENTWSELEAKVENNPWSSSVFDLSSFLTLEKDISEEVTEKTKIAQERIKTAMEKMNKKLQTLHSDIDFSGDIDKKVVKPVGVSDEERMMILKMLQEKKITAEEADHLLQILEEV